jgi:hypothetical protein
MYDLLLNSKEYSLVIQQIFEKSKQEILIPDFEDE